MIVTILLVMLKLGRHCSHNLIETLSYLRTKALRKGIWFQALTTEQRILTSLIRKNVKIVKNASLATVIARIMAKLIYAIQNSFLNMIDKIGRPIAESTAKAAYMMGWKEALEWVNDVNIVRWYGLTRYYFNMKTGWGVGVD